jgi:SAM-dependent methyltransferase
VPKLTIVIPAYNERRTLRTLLCAVLDVDLTPLGLTKEILVVDDGSTDGTREIVTSLGTGRAAELRPASRGAGSTPTARSGARSSGHPAANRGKGRRSGGDSGGHRRLRHRAGRRPRVRPDGLPEALRPLLDGRADVVYGSRFLGEERRVLFIGTSRQPVLTTLSNAVNDLNLTDMETCYKAFADVIRTSAEERPVRVRARGHREARQDALPDLRGPCRTPAAATRPARRSPGRTARGDLLHRPYRFASDVVEGAILEETLEKMSRLRHLNRRIYTTLRPWLGRRILEVGCGHGNLTEYLLAAADVVATDLDDVALQRTRATMSGYDNLEIHRWDMLDPLPPILPGAPVDSIVCLNVLEHIEDEHGALVNARRILEASRGRLILLVPAHPALYGPIDEKLGHFRRYTRKTLLAALARAGFRVESVQ